MEATCAKDQACKSSLFNPAVLVTVYTRFGYANVDLNRYEKQLEVVSETATTEAEQEE